MKFQYHVFREVDKKMIKYLAFLLTAIFLGGLFFFMKIRTNDDVLFEYNSYINVPTLKNIKDNNLLIILYNTFCLIYFWIKFFNYERFHSSYNVVTRFNSNKGQVIYKIVLASSHTFIWLIIYTSAVYFIFRKYVSFQINVFLNLYLFYECIMMAIYSISLNNKRRHFITGFICFLVPFLIWNYNIFFSIVFLIFTIIANLLMADFNRYKE